jgi:hypothetical protein
MARGNQGHSHAFHIPPSRSELSVAWGHFDALDEMILASLATVEAGYARLLKDLP